MGKSILDRIQAKLDLFRLEQRYTRRRNRRSTFQTNAIYVDGEYVFQIPNSTGSSSDSSFSRVDALHGKMMPPNRTTTGTMFSSEFVDETAAPERKRLHRLSSMASFGGVFGFKEKQRAFARRNSMIR